MVIGSGVPDVVLLDLSIGGMGAIATIRALLGELLSAEIVALASAEQACAVEAARHAGAIGCLPERQLTTELSKAILFAFNGMMFHVPEPAPPRVQPRGRCRLPDGQELTEREYELLWLLVQGHSNRHIAERMMITLSTVKFHLRNIRSKLGTRSRIETILYAFRHDLVPDV